MKELEKILNEIKASSVYGETKDGYGASIIPIGAVGRIISKHMKNNGWIPVEERLPTKEEFLKDDGRFILDDGNRRYQGLFDIYDGKFKFSRNTSGIYYELFEDKCVIAWQPLPEPYKPERE